MDCSPPGSSIHGISPDKNIGVGCHFLLQGIFPTQGPNLGLLPWQVDSLPLTLPGKPSHSSRGWKIQDWDASQFSFWWELSAFLTNGCLLTVSSHGKDVSFCYKATDLSWGPTNLNESNPNYLLKVPHLQILLLWWLGPQYANFERTQAFSS